jgi:DNA-binding CsgD family transcriptional regulator
MATAFDQSAEQQVIVVVLLPKGAYRPGSGDQRLAQIYQFSQSDGLVESSRVFPVSALARSATGAALPDEILARLADALEEPASPPSFGACPAPGQARPQFPALTPREQEVLQLVLEGLQNKNIASALRISMRTVENHRASIMRKTGSKSLPALVKLAIAAGAAYGSPPAARHRPVAAPRIRQAVADRHEFFMPA